MSIPPRPQGEVLIHVFGRTDVGRKREHNEDAFLIADLSSDGATLQPPTPVTHVASDKGSLLMVADGMGGAAAGEIASEMAVEIVLDEMRAGWAAESTPSPERFAQAIARAAKVANERIHAFASTQPEYRGMGTTATIAGLLGDTLYLAQVGDSRAYIVRNGEARQITKDQSLTQRLVEAGELTEEEAERSNRRNIILQALGPEPAVKVDLTYQPVRRGDALVLCSDGLSGQMSREQIARAVGPDRDLATACAALIDAANANGGPDNITAIVARFDGSGLELATAEDEIGHRVFPLADTDPSAEVEDGTDGGGASDNVAARPVTSSFARPQMADAARASGLPVSPSRQSMGTLIAKVLLATLVAGGVWLLVRAFRS